MRRYPKSIHSQIEASFHSIAAIGTKKKNSPEAIRGLGTLKAYREEAHRFASFCEQAGFTDLRDTIRVGKFLNAYLTKLRLHLLRKERAFATFERTCVAMAKLEKALNTFQKSSCPHSFSDVLGLQKAKARQGLVRSSRPSLRAYPDPLGLITAIPDPAFRLMANVQYWAGCRAEGVGAPARGRNPLTKENLGGIAIDPISGQAMGTVVVKEKGGKVTTHFLPPEQYGQLADFLSKNHELKGEYASYRRAIEMAARQTAQYSKGRGTHGLKCAFVKRRYLEAVRRGFSHDEARLMVARQSAHNRLDIVDLYMR